MMWKSFQSVNNKTAISTFYVNQKKKIRKKTKMFLSMADHKVRFNNKLNVNKKKHSKM